MTFILVEGNVLDFMTFILLEGYVLDHITTSRDFIFTQVPEDDHVYNNMENTLPHSNIPVINSTPIAPKFVPVSLNLLSLYR